nr:MAG TPA: hypothetical protein [Caudoviricetes sp.]
MRHTYTNTLTERLPTYFFDLRLQRSKKILLSSFSHL